MIRRLRNAIIGLSIASTLGGIVLYLEIERWSQREAQIGRQVTLRFEPGTSLPHLSRSLVQDGIIDNDTFFTLYVRLIRRNYRAFQSGTYLFDGNISPALVVDKITKGESYHPIVLTIAVPEGFRLKALIDRFVAHGVGTPQSLKKLVQDPGFLKRLKVPSGSLEGYIYPATYNFYAMPTPEEALSLMVKKFWQNLPANYEKELTTKGLNLHQAVTFASLIELETQTDDERPLVSEVIWRRLKDKAPIGIDAAIIYGIPDYAGDLKWSHLSDTRNPYNTRVHQGLPPGPIGSPSRRSLDAVLTPASEGYYYYVLKAGTTRHHFSRTLAEHNQAVKELVAALRTKRHDKTAGQPLHDGEASHTEQVKGTNRNSPAPDKAERKTSQSLKPSGQKP